MEHKKEHSAASVIWQK